MTFMEYSMRIKSKPQPMRILMLHGFGQSGDEFRVKTSKLRKFLAESSSLFLLPQCNGTFEFCYPTGPLEMPVYDPLGEYSHSLHSWWKDLDVVSEYKELSTTLEYLYHYILSEGPFDGVIGFSQGASLAMMLASWCEASMSPERRHALATQGIPLLMNPPQPPFGFAIAYSGFRGTPKYHGGFYNPKIQTPTLLVMAELDHMVSEVRSKELEVSCQRYETLFHHGGHYVPRGQTHLTGVTFFIERVLRMPDALETLPQDRSISPSLDSDSDSGGSSSAAPCNRKKIFSRPEVRCINRKNYRVYLRSH